ncbi:alcohol dehydrogenase catalytic domain-containing protein [Streptomyces thermoviolaceus]|uniref:2-deoxy-scyllo-inosamine dehydrogenase n=1 Tax=Streptomyces thermoviolaceus subsp. thermoviolaceus TaxID=66860 RepID=A0ABX0YMJ4_STRTL|nr:alcohol dehydrogenase catalytic domain-containing protein [Streptomyces thermoviolaceus]MCM3264224.1 alcohol dehydrogenase catalytic domain-containing protein [Streptomyces thermoviolaceus]NJP13751.1 alcohol dehydrogenase catalytic domain-containing protein [Streptomyces thermoviolaceus subsp. thermoviolaceus]GGV60815.1 dehydrogenase [Streptomyces thermoviolaceus subsp. apingens]GHA97925.1 dehydrogenase [Streptomyces thermoviolaceus subsp. thermoviolaceus]
MSEAVVVEAPGRHRLAPHVPCAPGPGEAQVAVHAVGICGSDREVWQGTRPEGYVRYPLTPGHEWSGTVRQVGAGVPEALVGRKVVGEGFRNCQVCDRCHAGETTLCTAGYEETGFTRPGAMAPTLTLPARLLHVLPDDADLTAAALLEPAACVAAAALKAGARPGERVAVVGTGTLGMLAVQFLAAGSPAELLVVGVHRGREELSRRFGATGFRTAGEPLPGDLDVVIEAAGSASAARTAAGLLRRGGRLVLTGIPAPGADGLDPTDLVVRQLEVHTVFGAPPDAWAHAVRTFAAGLLDPLPLVTHQLPLADFARAVDLVGSRDPGVGKVLLRP